MFSYRHISKDTLPSLCSLILYANIELHFHVFRIVLVSICDIKILNSILQLLVSSLDMWRVWVRRRGYRVFVGKPEGKRPLGRPRRRWVDNIRMDLQEVGCGHVDWIGLAQYRDRWRTLVSAVMNLRVPRNAGNFLTSCKPVSCSGRTLHHGVS